MTGSMPARRMCHSSWRFVPDFLGTFCATVSAELHALPNGKYEPENCDLPDLWRRQYLRTKQCFSPVLQRALQEH